MPIRKLNYTGRRVIRKQDIRIKISEDGVFSVENIAVKQSCPDVPDDALVVLEPYRQAQRREILCGTVGALTAPSVKERNLTDFGEAANVLFRIKIINNAEEGKILAAADRYRPELSGGKPRKSFLPVSAADIGPECWRISYENDSPELQINEEFGDWREVARSDAFMAFVYPSVLREILTHIFRQAEPGNGPDPDGDDDFAVWLRFGKKLTGEHPPPVGEDRDHEDADTWIKKAVAAFSRKLRAVALGKTIFNNEK